MACSISNGVETKFKEIYFVDNQFTERFKRVLIGLIKKANFPTAST
jgi:hypothetical protein